MATVRMSNRLIAEIEQAAKNKFDKINPKQKVDPTFGDKVFDTYVQPAVADFQDLYKQKFSQFDEAKVGSRNEVNYVKIHTDDDNEGVFGLELSTMRAAPEFLCDKWEKSIKLKVPLSEPAYQEAIRVATFNDNLHNKRYDFLSRIQDTLTNFTTLNQALKAVPTLADLVDDSYIQKVHEKVERKKVEQERKEQAQANLDDLSEVLLADKLLED